MELAKTIELIGKRWEILDKLSERKYYVSELAKELGKSPPEISKNLKELRKGGLVGCEQGEGERLKYCYVSDYAKRIFTAIIQVTQSKPKEKFEEWQINEFLSILEDQDLGDDLRLSYSESFRRMCSEHPKEIISHEGAQRLFEKIAADPFHDKIRKDLMRSLSAILRGLRKEWSNWVIKRLYPIFVKKIEDKEADEEIRVWAIGRVGQLASLGIDLSIKGKAEKQFLEIWFSGDTDPNSELGKQVKQKLVDLASKRLFEKVRTKAKDQNPKIKTKAEILLERLKECLLPK